MLWEYRKVKNCVRPSQNTPWERQDLQTADTRMKFQVLLPISFTQWDPWSARFRTSLSILVSQWTSKIANWTTIFLIWIRNTQAAKKSGLFRRDAKNLLQTSGWLQTWESLSHICFRIVCLGPFGELAYKVPHPSAAQSVLLVSRVVYTSVRRSRSRSKSYNYKAEKSKPCL